MPPLNWNSIGCKKCPKITHQSNGNLVFYNPVTKKTDYVKFNKDESPEYSVYKHIEELHNNKTTSKTKNTKTSISLDKLILDYTLDMKNKKSKHTIFNHVRYINHLKKHGNIENIEDITQGVLDNHFKLYTKTSTYNLNCSMHFVLSKYIELKYKIKIPVVEYKEKTRQDKIDSNNFDRFYLTNEINDILKMAKTYNERIYIFLMISFYAGLRYSECFNLEWSDIDFVNKKMHVQNKKQTKTTLEFNTKNTKPRSIPINETLYNFLQDLKSKSNTNYIIWGDLKKRDNSTLRPEFLRFQKYITGINATYADFTPHSARHTFASHLAQNGVSIFKISKWLGHSNVEITAQVYARLSPEKDDDINKLNF